MWIRALLVLALSTSATLRSSAQSAVQYQLDTTSSTSHIVTEGCATADGGCALLLGPPPSRIIWRADGQGDPTWCASLDTAHFGIKLIGLPDNGNLVIDPLPTEAITQIDGNDTARLRVTLAMLDAGGQMIWTRTLSLDIPVLHMGLGGVFTDYQCTVNSDGAMFLLATTEDADWFQTVHVIKLDPDGVIAWCKCVGRQNNAFQPSWPVQTVFDKFHFAPDELGGGYLVPEVQDPFDPMRARLIRISSSGELLWTRDYMYTNDPNDYRMNSCVTDVHGSALMIGRINTAGQNYGIIVKVDSSGSLLSADLYGGLPSYDGLDGGARTADDRFSFVSGRSFIEVDTGGALLHAQRISDVSVAPNDLSFFPVTTGYAQGRTLLPGYVTSTLQIFGDLNYYPQVWSFDPASPDACLLEIFPVTRYQVPDSLIQVLQDTDFVSIDVVATDENLIPHTTSLVPLGTHSACSLFVGIEQAFKVHHDFEVISSLVEKGGSIRVRADRDARIEVFSSAGTLVIATSLKANAEGRITTDGWAKGSYLARAISLDGSWISGAKPVVVY